MSHLAFRHAMSPPQLHCPDYYVRVPEGKLAEMALEHLITMHDPAVIADTHRWRVSGRRAGITEWQGLHAGQPISIGWDWTQLEDGDVRALKVVTPRTNVMVIDTKGYDIPEAVSAPALWELIATLPWQEHVLAAVASEPRAQYAGH